jgi:alcohol dehydrogenase class IV
MWYFVSPQIVFGEGALAALDELKGQRALIVTDATLLRLGFADRVKAHLRHFQVELFAAVEPDPSLQTVRAGAALALDFAPDWIIGLGGGSCMDAAKAIWVCYERPDLDPAEITPMSELGLRHKARLVTIPTTSGTGAEATWAIVLTDAEIQRKLCLGNRENLADLAILDPALVVDLPPTLTADTGMDALTHAIEGYTCAWRNDFTDGLCLHAARLIMQYLPRAVADGGDLEARERMHNAAAIAGLGFGNAMASLAHALGHALGATFHTPHGRAVGLFLPYTIEYIGAEASERFAELAQFLGAAASTGALAERVRRLSRVVGSPTRVAELGIPRDAFLDALDRLVDHAANDGTILTTPRNPSNDDLRRLFLCAYDGVSPDF